MPHRDIQTLDPATFQATLDAAALPVLVDFWAPWCAPCRALAPRLQQVADRFAGELEVRKVDVDTAPELAARLKIRGIPTLMLFKHGQPHSARVGLQTEAELTAWFQTAL